jgi:hypothetical protein
MVESGDLEQLPHQTRETADADLATSIAYLFGDPDNRTKSHAAHVREFAQVQDQAGKPICNARIALRLERRSALGIHSAGYTQNNLVPNQCPLDGHDRQKSAPHNSQRQSFFAFAANIFTNVSTLD